LEGEESRKENSQSGEATALLYKCDTCQQAFRHRQDTARHRCATTCPNNGQTEI